MPIKTSAVRNQPQPQSHNTEPAIKIPPDDHLSPRTLGHDPPPLAGGSSIFESAGDVGDELIDGGIGEGDHLLVGAVLDRMGDEQP